MISKTRKIADFDVHAMGLGCMNYAFGYNTVSAADAKALLKKSLTTECNFYDTAYLYGNGVSEEILGETLKDQRKNIFIASKCGLDNSGIDGRPETLNAQCDISLQRLQTDVIDLYYLHRVDPKVPIEESVGALRRLVDAGKIRAIGVSETSSANLARAIAETPIAAVQSEYSLWSRTPEFGILDLCEQHDTTFVPFCPLGRGFFAGSAQEISQLPDSDLRCTIAHPRFEGDNYKANCELLAKFGEIAADNHCTTGQLALAWLLHQGSQTMVPIPGTTNIAHFMENMQAVEVELDDATLAAIDELINEDTVAGTRYNESRMADQDSERDRLS